jgi:sulfatase maturation enzyme AslB (radical SAM superfamily)
MDDSKIRIGHDLMKLETHKNILEVKNISLNEDDFSIYWTMGAACNYRCSYCFQKSRNRTMPELSEKQIENLIKNIENLKEKKVKVDLVGGEPTIFAYYERIVVELEKLDNVVNIQTETNLSKDLHYFENLFNKIVNKEKLTFSASYHLEFGNFDEFISKALYFNKNNIRIYMTIMAHPMKMEEVKLLLEKLELNLNKNIRFQFGVVLDMGIPDQRYNKVDLEWIESTNNQIRERYDKENNGIIIKYKCKEQIYEEKTTSRMAIAKGMNVFKDMKCAAGVEMIRIYENGNINPANCFLHYNQTNYLNGKNIFTENESIRSTNPITCPFYKCTCAADISVTKYR